MVRLAFGSFGDSLNVGSLKAHLAKFIATSLFVFAGVGSAKAYGKLTSDAALDPPGLMAVAVAHAFALFVGVSFAANISGLAVDVNITILVGIFYWIAQILGSIVSCLLLLSVTDGLSVPTHGVASGMTALEGLVMETVITFAVVYTVYATAAAEPTSSYKKAKINLNTKFKARSSVRVQSSFTFKARVGLEIKIKEFTRLGSIILV